MSITAFTTDPERDVSVELIPSLVQQLKEKQERLNIQLKQVAEALDVLENPTSALTVLENANAESLFNIIWNAKRC